MQKHSEGGTAGQAEGARLPLSTGSPFCVAELSRSSKLKFSSWEIFAAPDGKVIPERHTFDSTRRN